MNKWEVVEAIKKRGYNISDRTLLHYEYWGMVEKPERGGGGKGGRWVKYKDNVVDDAINAHRLLKVTTREMLSLMKEKNPKLYKEYVKFILENL